MILIDPKTFQIQFINKTHPSRRIEDIIGKEVFIFITAEHVDLYKQMLNEVVANLKPTTIDLEGNSENVTGKSWYRSTVTPIFDENGKLENILVVSNDHTSAKLKEIEFANQEERLFSIINNTKDIILSIDKNLNITEFNSVFKEMVISMVKAGIIKNTPVLDYIDATKHEHLKSIYKKTLAGENIIDIEKFVIPHGFLYYETSYNPIFDYDKEIIGISIFSKNITDRILNEQKLQSSLKDRGVLLAEIHHRIKNNLALISSMLHLKEMSLTNEEAKNALSESRKRIKSTALVHEMLYRNDRFQNISVKEYISELFENIKLNPSIELVLEGDDEVLELDKSSSFGLLMHELIMNSMKHSFKEKQMGKLNIEITKDRNSFNLKYGDCSGKFPAEVDFDNATTTGLILIHTFIEQLNGTILLISKEPPTYHIIIPTH